MAIFTNTSENILSAAEIIKNGGLVGIPTETVYGLGADAFNSIAVSKIFEAKKRPHFDPLIVHIAELSYLEKIAEVDNPVITKLIKAFWPGPLTLILKKKECIPFIVTSGLNTVAVRMPNHKTALEIIKHAGGAVAAPSANPFGYLSPTTAEHVDSQLGDRIDMVIDGGACTIGVESTVIDVTGEVPIVLRPGGLEIEKIEAVVGKIEIYNRKIANISSPGQLESHYSPRTPLIIISKIEDLKIDNKEQFGVLLFSKKEISGKYGAVEILSDSGDVVEAASRLFQCLHTLDKSGVKVIYAEQVPERGIGVAIIDRLYKASKK